MVSSTAMADSYPRYRRNEEDDYDASAPPPYYVEDDDDQRRYETGRSGGGDFDEFPRSRPQEATNEKQAREPFYGRPEENETLGGYLFNRTLGPLWRGSHTILRVDLRRSLRYDGPIFGDQRSRRRSAPKGATASSGGADYYDEEEAGIRDSRGWFNGLSGGGTRFKLMQVWDAPEVFGELRQPWNLNVGLGVNLEVDKGLIEPKVRIRARHVALHLLPRPEVELRGKWPIGKTPLAIHAKYRIPLTTDFEDIWWGSGARLLVNFFNPLGSGFHLTPGGVEFDEHLVNLGEHTKLRFAAALEFPRKFPVENDEQAIKLRVYRLGVKTVIEPGVTR